MLNLLALAWVVVTAAANRGAAQASLEEAELPLTMPTLRKEQPSPTKSEVASPLPRSVERNPVFFSAQAGFSLGSHGYIATGMNAAIELGATLPFLGRTLGVSGQLGFHTASGGAPSPIGRFNTTVYAGSVAVLGCYQPELGPGRLRLRVGPLLQLASVEAQRASATQSDFGLGVGASFRAGYLWSLSSRHAVGLETGYDLAPIARVNLPWIDHRWTISLSYLFGQG